MPVMAAASGNAARQRPAHCAHNSRAAVAMHASDLTGMLVRSPPGELSAQEAIDAAARWRGAFAAEYGFARAAGHLPSDGVVFVVCLA